MWNNKKAKAKNQENVNYMGKKNKSEFPEFIEICKMDQKWLGELLFEKLIETGYENVTKADGFIYAKGEIPVLLTAHMDTVHMHMVVDFYERKENGNHIISSPQGIGGDDRCGIYMILEIIKTHKCSVLFCEDEEIGGVGSRKFIKNKDLLEEISELKYMIELDRAGKYDAVFYDCNNIDFSSFIINNTGYLETFGSFSDISILAPAAGIAAVNLSCGYYKAHTELEEVVVEEMLNTIHVVKNLLEVECERFEYIDSEIHDMWFDNYDDYDFELGEESSVRLVVYMDDDFCSITGRSEEECWGKFFLRNKDLSFYDVYDYDVFCV